MNATQLTPIRLYLLQLALGEDGTPIPGYLIQTSDGKNILIDTGVPLDGSFIPNSGHKLHITSVVDQLATLGLTPAIFTFLSVPILIPTTPAAMMPSPGPNSLSNALITNSLAQPRIDASL